MPLTAFLQVVAQCVGAAKVAGHIVTDKHFDSGWRLLPEVWKEAGYLLQAVERHAGEL
jgi:hypothetical protein